MQRSRGIKDRIQKKDYRDRPLSRAAILFKKLMSTRDGYYNVLLEV
ncbi:MAG: hypothetical protein ACMUEL_00695 [Flavobacteriales bacterium Tduv]